MIIIKTNILSNEGNFSYIVEGHAGYAEHGKDIVCSAISSLHYSFLLWLEMAEIEFESVDDGEKVGVSVIDKRARDCYNMVIAGFDGIAYQYGKNVKIIYT